MSFWSKLMGGSVARNVAKPTHTNVSNQMIREAGKVENYLKRLSLEKGVSDVIITNNVVNLDVYKLRAAIEKANLSDMGSNIAEMVELLQFVQNMLNLAESVDPKKADKLRNSVVKLGNAFDELRDVTDDCDALIKALNEMIGRVRKLKSSSVEVQGLLKQYEGLSLGAAQKVIYELQYYRGGRAPSEMYAGGQQSQPKFIRGVA